MTAKTYKTKDNKGLTMKMEIKYLAIVSIAVLALLPMTVDIHHTAAAGPASAETGKIRQFDYRVCTVQFDRVTFVNGAWIGTVQPAEGNTDKAILSCPLVHEYLQQAGKDGWELVAVFSQSHGVNPNAGDDTTQTLFLKKEK